MVDGGLRRLPFRIRPLPDEPFDSWLEAYAHAYQATIAEMVLSLGLQETRSTPAPAAHGSLNSWATSLTPTQLEHLEQATGLPSEDFARTTRSHFAGAATRFTSNGRISPTSASSGVAGRFCPECLLDSGGRWRITWQFAFGFACVRHRRILVDTCPECGSAPRQFDHPPLLIPTPGHCHNRASMSTELWSRCGADLTVGDERIPASEVVLDAQRAVLRIVSTGIAKFGLYADDPQPAVVVLEDLRLLARISRAVLRTNATLLDSAGLGTALVEQFHSLKASKAERSLAHPRSAILAAVGNACGYLALSEPERIGPLLANRVASSATTGRYSRPFARVIDQTLGRRRRPTTTLRSLSSHVVGDPAERARKIPALLWRDWTQQLAPNRMDQEVAASALAATVVLAGSDLTHGAALKLLDPRLSERRVTHLMMTLGDSRAEEQTLSAVARLARHLDRTAPPIDYGRRRSLDYTGLLTEPEWVAICRDIRVLPGAGRRWRVARLSLFTLLTGSRADAAPTQLLATTSSERAAARKFIDTAPRRVRTRIEQVGQEFLSARDIDEPLAWSPPLDLLTTPSPAPGGHTGPHEDEWPDAKPALERLHVAAPGESLVSAYTSGRSAESLASEYGVGKQTVLRALQVTDTPRRPVGRAARIDVDDGWLRRRYLVEKATIIEIAAELGCSNQSVSRYLKRAGIPARPRGSGSRAEYLRSHPLASESKLLQKALIGQDSLERARRFLVVVAHPNLGAAAQELEVAASVLGHQLQLMELAVGGALVIRAQNGQPQALTPLGRRLKRELIRARDERPDLWGEQRVALPPTEIRARPSRRAQASRRPRPSETSS